MKQISTLLLLSIVTLSSLHAQDNEARTKEDIKLAVKWSPLHLVAPYPTLQVALEHRVTSKYSVQYEGGPVMMINGFNPFSDSKESRFRGFKAKVDVRRHFFRSNRHFFCAQEIFYNRVNNSREDVFLVHPVENDNSADYTETVNYSKRYREYGGVFKVGVIKSAGRFCFEIYCGVSLSYMEQYTVNAPPYPQYQSQSSYSRLESLDPLLNISRPFNNQNINLRPAFGIRLGYVVW